MILSIRKIYLLLFWVVVSLIPQEAHSQFLQESQDESQIQKFARYLYNLELYDLAAEEYERLIYINKSNPEHLKYLIKSYQGAGNIDKLRSRISKIEFTDPDIVDEYIYALILESINEEATAIYQKHSTDFSLEKQHKIEFDLALAEKKWDNSLEQFTSLSLAEKMKYEPLMNQIKGAKYKSPTTAAILSGIIPGSGRIYAKDNVDGVISFIFVASTAYQSYRRFKQKGTKSIAGWVYGGVSLGFYISNIYGSYQSAKFYNNNIDKELHAKSLDIIRLD